MHEVVEPTPEERDELAGLVGRVTANIGPDERLLVLTTNEIATVLDRLVRAGHPGPAIAEKIERQTR